MGTVFEWYHSEAAVVKAIKSVRLGKLDKTRQGMVRYKEAYNTPL